MLVLVENGLIKDVDFTGAMCPNDVPLTDFTDAMLIPGLVDAHAHLCWDPTKEPQHLRDEADRALVERAHNHAQQALRCGITTIRDLGDRHYATVSLRERYRRERAAGPELLVSGPPLTRTGGHCWFLGGEADTAVGLVDAVDEHASRGVDWIKIMATGGFRTHSTNPGQPQYSSVELGAVVDAAHRVGLPVTAHAHATAGIAAAVKAGVDGLEHCTFVGQAGAVVDDNVLESIVNQGIWCGITIARPQPDMPAQTLAVLERKWDNVRHIMAAGARIAFSADAGINPSKPHDVLPRDLVYLTHQGFARADVLAGATARAAASCGLGHRKGHIAAGYDADLLAVDDVRSNIEALCRVNAIWRAGTPIALDTPKTAN